MSHSNIPGDQKLCECCDSGCPAHVGESACTKEFPEELGFLLYRVDMEDISGTLFCEACAADAMESGLFSEQRHG